MCVVLYFDDLVLGNSCVHFRPWQHWLTAISPT